MMNWLKNIWNAQRNAARVRELEIQIELLSFPKEEQYDQVDRIPGEWREVNLETMERLAAGDQQADAWHRSTMALARDKIRIGLSDTELLIAKKLGKTPEEYAEAKAKMIPIPGAEFFS